jgi:hypothetical protein
VSTEIEKMATLLRSFIKQVESDVKFKTDLYTKYDEERKTEALTQFEHESWLLCQTAQEMRTKQNARRELQKMPDLHKAEGKLRQPASLIFDKWTQKTLSESRSIQEDHLYSFWPDERSNVEMLLVKLKGVLDHPQNKIETRAAQLCHTHIIEYLFAGMNKRLLSENVRNHFLNKHGIVLKTEEADPPEWKKTIPLKNNPGRRSVSSEKIVNYIKYLTDWFLLNPAKFYTVGQTILAIWIELAIAHCGRRICPLTDILSIKERDIRVSNESCYCISIRKRLIPISKSLSDMLLCISDQRVENPTIFSIDRSTIENHLRSASLDLGYDLELFPVTPETFLERPIECGVDAE